jgi:hypothetical protein
LEASESIDTYSPGRDIVQQAVDFAAYAALETLGAIA